MISVHGLSYSYQTEKETIKALDNICLDIVNGEWLGVIGPNGSGKSTFARHLNALLKPESGEILVDGLNTQNQEHLWRIRQKVGYVFQNPDNQLVATTVEEDVAFGPENLGIPSDEIIERVAESLKIVGMYEYRTAAPHLLSGGQKQRVAIAGALAMRPEYIVMDEATSMLDPQGREEVLQTLRKLNKESGLTIIYITHFMEEVVTADRVVVLNQGRIHAIDSPEKIFSRADDLLELGLDLPEITILANKLKKDGWLPDVGILSIDEMVDKLCQLS